MIIFEKLGSVLKQCQRIIMIIIIVLVINVEKIISVKYATYAVAKRNPEKNQAYELLQKHVKLKVWPVASPGQIHNQDFLKTIKKSSSLPYIFPIITGSLLSKYVVSSFRGVRCRLSTEFMQV